jgi:hypothetical protein
MKIQLKVLFTTAIAAFAMNVMAAWPDKTITLVVPFPPGGSTDQMARAIAPKMQTSLGQSIIIDNNLFLIDIGKICSKIYKENNIYNKSFYTSVTGRYTLIDNNSINLEFDKFRKNLDELKNLDIIKNFF